MAPVGQVPDMTRQVVSARSGHAVAPHPERPILASRHALQAANQGDQRTLLRGIRPELPGRLRGSDPGLTPGIASYQS